MGLFIFLIISITPFSCELSGGMRDATNNSNAIIIYFEPGSAELVPSILDKKVSHLDPKSEYKICCYSCHQDGLKNSECRLALAEKRAKKIKYLLIQEGFQEDNISTMVYDHGPECKAVIVRIN